MKNSPVRKKIIETASNLFYKSGYNLTGINEIIKEAGIAKATLYNHFKSKEDICIAYLAYKNDTFLKEIEEFCDRAPKGKQQILALFDFLQQFFRDKDFNGCWCINTVSEIPRQDERIRAEIQQQKREFVEFIESLVSANSIGNPDDTGLLARQIYLLYESAIAESHLHQNAWPIESAKRMCHKIVE